MNNEQKENDELFASLNLDLSNLMPEEIEKLKNVLIRQKKFEKEIEQSIRYNYIFNFFLNFSSLFIFYLK